MVKAALTLQFFGFLNSQLQTEVHSTPESIPTKHDITWSKEGLLFFIKKSKTADQAGVGTTISVGLMRGATCPVSTMQANLNHYQGFKQVVSFHFRSG